LYIEILLQNYQEFFCVSDLEPDWIRILSGQWIRVRIESPFQEGKNDPQKGKNFMFLSAGCSPWCAGGFSYNLKARHGGLKIK
jgi:hypothetical protein